MALGPLEGPVFDIIDPRFASCIVTGARVERIWTGGQWTEGPAWLASRGLLVWSDIPGDRILAWEEATGQVSIFRRLGNSPNGNTVDRQGHLITCEQIPHRIVRTEPDGTITPLVDRIGGRRFNSPNDVVVASDGAIWFTDPTYGRVSGPGAELNVNGCHVYRFDPANSAVHQMTTDFVMPNGLAFSPDETLLYIVDTGGTERPGGPDHVRCFSMGLDWTLSGGAVLAESGGHFDGLRVDSEGRLWMGADEGVRCYLPDGTLIGRIGLPERAANLTFGGAGRNILMITATTSVYVCPVNAVGATP
ncbi:SMP-30/gluconolactonase/LRE family protein [Ensifer adhaerens]|uniref:SMP-30/gluconolactonase/LRE family protein n=1 Tax=Ensifer adhaerens TaxID=106592 RepID=UPI000CF1B527|nr:SMP-30/gluconolactonase/LRE family protein [Ensifer adhaerens]